MNKFRIFLNRLGQWFREHLKPNIESKNKTNNEPGPWERIGIMFGTMLSIAVLQHVVFHLSDRRRAYNKLNNNE